MTEIYFLRLKVQDEGTRKYGGRGRAVCFPGGPVVKNPLVNAGDMGSIPCPGRSHMLWSYRAHTPQLLKSYSPELVHRKRSRCHETPAHRDPK